MFVQYTLKKYPFTTSIFGGFEDSSLSEILYIITYIDDECYRTLYKHGKMIARQQIYNGVSYGRME